MADLGTIIGDVAPIAAGVLGYAGAKQQMDASSAMAANQMIFQERMSSTAYQRAMADMRAAGLNPMLAYQQGGATTPGGAMGTATNPIGAGVSTAMDAVQAVQSLRTQSAQRKLLGAQAEKTQWEAEQAHAEMTDPNSLTDRDGNPLLPRTYYGMMKRAMMDRMRAETARASSAAALARAELPAATIRGSKFGYWADKLGPAVSGAAKGLAAAEAVPF